MEIEELCHKDFHIWDINAMRQRWTDGDEYTFRKSARPEHGLMYFAACEAVYETQDGHQYHAAKGDLFFIAKGTNYIIQFSNCEPKTVHCLLVNFQLLGEDGAELIPEERIQRLPIPPDHAQRALCNLNNIFYAHVYSPGAMKGHLYQLLSEIGQLLRQRRLPPPPHSLSVVLMWLEQHYHENVPVSELAKMCCMGESNFRNCFKDYTGLSPSQYRLDMRINQSMRMLKSTTSSMAEIAVSVGFTDLNYFSRLFKKRTGLTPSEFKKQSDLC